MDEENNYYFYQMLVLLIFILADWFYLGLSNWSYCWFFLLGWNLGHLGEATEKLNEKNK
jgi:arginine exporter protein ArgO|tara:strand:+ start:268 stop:444 length:177 start_codon:yes stop_codon:yes gene_type:complete